MFDTMVTIVGNVLNTPQWRRIDDGHVLVANFKVATTSRRYDRQSNRWVDGASLRVRVNCWRRLAENVGACVTVGDPVVVTGRLYSREWEGEDKVRRVSYELDAVAVGHDLAKGRGRFTRQRASMSTTAIEDTDAESRVGGALSTPADDLNDLPRQRVFDEELGGYVTAVDVPGEFGSGFSAASSLGAYAAGLRADSPEFDFAGTGADGEAEFGRGDFAAEAANEADDEAGSEQAGSEQAGSERALDDEAADGDQPGTPDGDPAGDPDEPREPNPRRRRTRIPVPA